MTSMTCESWNGNEKCPRFDCTSISEADVELLSLETRILKREVTGMFAGRENYFGPAS